MTEIPLDLMVEILIRLPGKYLARFKCVSKQWSSLISSRYFCERLYTIRQRKRRPHLYMCLVDKDGQSALLSMSSTSPDNTCFVVDQDLSIPGMGGYYLNDLDGLMCFSVGKKACIYNPSTGQRLTLPKINADIIADQGQTRYINRYYIGYDPVNDQNKLLCTSVMYSYRLSNLKSEHWVFMLEAGGSWKKAVSHENYRPHAPFARGQSISGSVVHYLAWHDMYTCVIVSFDVRSEELTTIIAPEGVRDDMPIPALEMKAELIDYDAEKKEWSKRSLVLQPCQRHLVQDTEFIVKGTTQDGKVILAPVDMHSGFYILCYDLQSNGLSKVEINGVPHRWFDKECYYDLRLMSESERASILVDFPAPVSMFSVVTLIGGFTTVALQYVVKGGMDMGSASVMGLKNLMGYAVLGGLVGGGGFTFNAWVIKRKGPVVVSLFSPIATVVCVVVSAFSMDDSFNLGSFAGMALMFGGLYFVLWAKRKEECGEGDEVKEDEEESLLRTEFDLEKPLLR
ncbi:hypothetical protein Bca52824_003496 [Brassica carinata]|uniref:F-box domain-containing protein n=1 Tax=Brassica carinata TaxID=52824 RepID=A0A8X7WMS5_BRACI|nr:hypothetical protein Bca52824_003496 [Brassica carinata]